MGYFKKWNRITGWVAFAISAVVYLMTIEPTASLWDCAEFIATSYKLEVGHPPGAPLFMMIARFFTIFAPSTAEVGAMVNAMSALCGAFTVLFLCWSITHLARRIYERDGQQMSKSQTWAALGAGLVGAVAYCFTDTQWFSAVEGEVYSMSSMFTALVFWCILQWENVADKPHSTRWLILIAYLMGLSTGVHILNLLCIPAIVFVYYFKKYPKVTWKGVVGAMAVTGVILVAINYIIIPYTVTVGAVFDRLFVNSFGLPVNSGLVFFALLIFVLCAFGIYITHKKGKALANIIVLCTTFILLGFSSYASMVIRAQADPPMNSNDPSNAYGLTSVLAREQYGDRPLLYGPYYSSPVLKSMTGDATWLGEDGKYHSRKVITGYAYPDDFKYLFPRVWNHDPLKIRGYKAWGVTGRPGFYEGERLAENVPTAGDNLRFFFSYQLNHMYWRYFMWNFVGRQNDIQSDGGLVNGNWLSGIGFIDELYLGPQDGLPSEMAENKARNTYFFLPFLLGLIGLIYQLGRDKKNFTIVMWMFVMMGVALVVYFNTAPGEPRERDYVYTGSFYAFCIWIGLGVLAVKDWLAKVTKKENVAITVTAVAVCASVPVLLGAQNWDDHDRSGRYVTRDIGWNYLQSCLPNSIIINYGDNDTFPLWYEQEVEGVRPDVRIMNMSYLSGEWYIDQMKHKYNESEPVPFSLPQSKYMRTNESVYLADNIQDRVSLRELMAFIKRTDKGSMIEYGDISMDYIPTRKLYLPVNKENAVASGIVKPEDAHLMVDSIPINLSGGSILRGELMILDMLANFDWARPIYFTMPQTVDAFGLREYLQFDGSTYRLVPIRTPQTDANPFVGRVDAEYIYPLLTETFRYGNVADPKVYADHFTNYNYSAIQTRNAFARAADALMAQGDTIRAVELLDRAIELMPFDQIRHSYTQTIPLILSYYKAGEFSKGNAVLEDYARVQTEYFNYFFRFKGAKADSVMAELRNNIDMLELLYSIAERYRQTDQADAIYEVIGWMYEDQNGETGAEQEGD